MTACVVVTGAGGELGRRVLAAARARSDVEIVVGTTLSERSPGDLQPERWLDRLNLARDEDAKRLRHAIEPYLPRHIALVHCAGCFPPPSPLHRTTLDTVGATFAANLLSFVGAAGALIPLMRRQRSGGLVAFTSHTQSSAYPFMGPFNLSKLALLSAIQTLANENARFNIAANAVAVATLQTESERRIKPDGSFEDWVPAEDVASYAIDLALCRSPSVNGSEIQYWRYSPSFFEHSVFARNSISIAKVDPDDE